MKAESKILETLYDAISSISEELMTRAGTPIKPPYEEFLTKRLRGTLLKYKREEKEIEARDSYDKKKLWKIAQVRIALEFCHFGHIHIDRAWSALLLNDYAKFVFEACAASVWFGRMRMVYDSYQNDLFPRLGALQTSLHGAVKGGLKSGVTRRKQSILPAKAILIAERDKLIGLGKSSCYVCAMLAKNYSCTTDYVRKVLKGD